MAVTRIVVLFNLKPGHRISEYEAWARSRDLPTVNDLASVRKFEVFKSLSLLGSEAKPPYQYVEVIDVKDMAVFGEDVATPAMTAIAGEFAQFADATFMLMKKIGWRRKPT